MSAAEPPVEPITKTEFDLGAEAPKLIAEFIGTFALIFLGGGAILSGADLVGTAFAHGLAIGVMVTAVGHVSGGHFNPAVTAGFLVTKRIEPVLGGVYIVTQLLGATVAAIALRLAFDNDVVNLDLAVPALGDNTSNLAGVGIEAVLTFFLLFVIFGIAVDNRGAFAAVVGIPIGFVIVMDILMGGPLTGAAMNPARWFGPALIFGDWQDGWVWIVGPLLGGAAAALLYDRFMLQREDGPAA